MKIEKNEITPLILDGFGSNFFCGYLYQGRIRQVFDLTYFSRSQRSKVAVDAELSQWQLSSMSMNILLIFTEVSTWSMDHFIPPLATRGHCVKTEKVL